MKYALLATALAAGCAAAPSEAGSFSPSGAQTTAPVPKAAAPASPLSGYRHFHEVHEYTLESNDPSRIASVATGPTAARLAAAVRENRRRGIVQRGHAVPHPKVLSADLTNAYIVDCITTSGPWTYNTRTGKRLGYPPKPRRSLVYATLSYSQGAWKVSQISSPRNPKC